MKKYAKKKLNIVDMSARMRVEIIPASKEEIDRFDRELDELNDKIQNIVNIYEHNLSRTIETMFLSDNIDVCEHESSSYFINKYSDIIEGTNHDKVQKKLDKYQCYLKNSYGK